MSGHAAFLQEILAHPDDDVPRLVYADWLDEQGDPRGEFIRVQCLLAKLPFEDDRRWSLQTRETLLRRQFGKEWASGICEHAIHWQFRRGFIEQITIPAETFLEHAPELFQVAPIRGLKLLEPASQLSALAASPWLERLESLDLSRSELDWFGFEDLAWSPSLIHLKELNLSDTPLCNDRGLRMLAQCEFLHNLQALNLSQRRGESIEPCAISPSAIQELSDSPCFKNLTSLILANYGPDGGRIICALASSPLLGQLRSLDLSHNPNHVFNLPAGSPLDQLFQSAYAANLEHLRLQWNQFSMSVSSFADSPHLANLKSLVIRLDFLSANGRTKKNFLRSPNVRNLVSLELSACKVTDPFFQELFESKAFENLKELNLNATNPGDGQMQALAASPILGQLRALSIQASKSKARIAHRLTPDGFRAFAQTPASQLEILDLANQSISDLSPLAESAISQNLRALGLSNTQIGDSAVEILCDPDAFPNLELLDLHSVDLNEESQNRLREYFGAGVELSPNPAGNPRSEDQ